MHIYTVAYYLLPITYYLLFKESLIAMVYFSLL